MLLRSGFIVAVFTFISRIFGLVRELFIAYVFGATAVADAINVAFKLPNLFRRVFAEGALSAVFIPIFNNKFLESKEAACKISGEIFTLLLITLSVLVIVIEIFMPNIMFILAPGFYRDIEKFNLTVLLCRITMPYIVFISISALIGGMLNSVKRFAAFAFIPVILSVSVVIGTILLQNSIDSSIAMAISVILAGILQLLFMFCCALRAGLSFPIGCNLKDKDVKSFLSNMVPATLSAGVYQLNLFISQSIASFLPGAVSILSYADRIYQFPLSIIGITFGTILLPELSTIYKTKNLAQAKTLQDKSIKLGLFLSIPASLGIILLAHPIIHIIYERGAFNEIDTIKTAQTISAFALGLPAFVLSKILTPIFYANSDTKTPLRVTIYSLTINTMLNVVLMYKFDHIGIAMGSSIAAWFGVCLLYIYAKKYEFSIKLDYTMKLFMFKLFFCAVSMVLVTTTIKYYYSSFYYHEFMLVKVISLLVTIIIAIATLLATSFCLKLHKDI